MQPQPEWERAAGRLEAPGRDAALILARSYCDLGRYDEALTMYEEVLGEEQLDPRACGGLLLAAAGTGDAVRLDDAWQQVCACLGGEGDLELRALYDRLRRGLIGAAASSRSEATPARR